jgi:hypothetical protein
MKQTFHKKVVFLLSQEGQHRNYVSNLIQEPDKDDPRQTKIDFEFDDDVQKAMPLTDKDSKSVAALLIQPFYQNAKNRGLGHNDAIDFVQHLVGIDEVDVTLEMQNQNDELTQKDLGDWNDLVDTLSE